MTKQERAARTRRALILSAAEVFDQEGFAPASLTMISSRAGVSNGALHFHFANKNAVAEAVQGEALSVLRQIAHAWPEGPRPRSSPSSTPRTRWPSDSRTMSCCGPVSG